MRRTGTKAAIDSASNKTGSLRSSLSPALDDPLRSLTDYAKRQPVQALLAAACAGAILTMIRR